MCIIGGLKSFTISRQTINLDTNMAERNISESEDYCHTFLSSRTIVDAKHLTIIAVFSASMIPFSVCFNSVLILHLQRDRLYPRVSKALFTLLSLSDLFVGVIVLPLYVTILQSYPNEIHCELEITAQFLAALFCGTSGRVTAVIALDRFLIVRYRHWYNAISIKRKICVLMASSILLSLLAATSLTLGTVKSTYHLSLSVWGTIDVFFLGGSIIMYMSAYFSVKRYVKTSRVWKMETKTPRQKYDQKIAKTIAMVLTVMCSTYGPFVLINVVANFVKNNTIVSVTTLWAYFLLFCNSSLNACVFLAKHRTHSSRLYPMLVSRRPFTIPA